MADASGQEGAAPVVALRETVVVLSLGGAAFAVALDAVRRVLPLLAVRPLPDAPEIALGVINLEGTPVPVLDLRKRLGMPCRTVEASDQLLVLWTGRLTVALPVDQVLGLREVVLSEVTRPDDVLPGTRGLAGIVALSDELLFIHDIESFLWETEERQLRRALEQSEPS